MPINRTEIERLIDDFETKAGKGTLNFVHYKINEAYQYCADRLRELL